MSKAAPPHTPTRRAVFAFGGALASIGLTAGAAASVADIAPSPADPDAVLLGVHPDLIAAVREVNACEMWEGPLPVGWPDADLDDWITRTGERLLEVCWDIVDAPPAQMAEGRALKAAAAMYQLRMVYGPGEWQGAGEEQAWLVLSELAGDVYVPPAVPEHLRQTTEPGRA